MKVCYQNGIIFLPKVRISEKDSPGGIFNDEKSFVEKPGGVAADDRIRVVLAHGGAAGNAEKDDNDDDEGGGGK